MSEKKTPPMDIAELADFIAAFDQATVELKVSHDKLRAKADQLAGELSIKNQELSTKVEEVSALKTYLTNILKSITDGVLTLNIENRLVALNDTAGSLFPGAVIAGQHVSEVLGSSFGEIAEILIATMRDESSVDSMVVEASTEDGIMRSLSVSASPLKDGTGCTIGAVATFRDNTEVRQLGRVLQRKERLAALGQMSAQLAHEIRNPLGGIELYASLLERSLADKPEEQRLSTKIISATSRLNRLVEDMLTFTRPAEINKSKVNPAHLIDEAIELTFASFQDSKIKIIRDYNNVLFNLDPDYLQRAFLNVIFNAVQMMGDDGCLHLSINIEERAGESFLIVKIADTGPGISNEIKEKIFNPFFTKRENGTGLGLAIVQKIVQDHDGVVFVEDNTPHGAIFVFEFPN